MIMTHPDDYVNVQTTNTVSLKPLMVVSLLLLAFGMG